MITYPTTADFATATHAATVVTYTAVANGRHCLDKVQFSYSAAPTGGRLTVEDGAGNVVKDLTITAAGPLSVDLSMIGTPNTAMIITLADGGAAIVGKMNCGHYVS